MRADAERSEATAGQRPIGYNSSLWRTTVKFGLKEAGKIPLDRG